MKFLEDRNMRSVNETLDLLKLANEAVAQRLEILRNEPTEKPKLERELWRKQLLEETLSAVEETAAAS
jgi:hypothetical protein